ncbi:uncharacterized protein SCHCODRAFT_02729893 [Schizophyllum commune H4-8]|uniref:uncharacterized protein n=1 Tax=Schizophyllum commune (strain H4-8 / FGSC 9210) TaxID=578458 RepID=UPI00215F22DB|nr:uncharacterized protein SCHCODRAFT_02729893 [Schizophyllum commune H4-8]KAI5893454.1 hypothetical protein SCHCODRAFT_02729893 [Schizophyllum commune H4-8]
MECAFQKRQKRVACSCFGACRMSGRNSRALEPRRRGVATQQTASELDLLPRMCMFRTAEQEVKQPPKHPAVICAQVSILPAWLGPS